MNKKEIYEYIVIKIDKWVNEWKVRGLFCPLSVEGEVELENQHFATIW